MERNPDNRRNLPFPEVGQSSELKDNDDHRVAAYQAIDQHPGLYISVSHGSFATVLDHEARTDIFHRKTAEIPWGGPDTFTLAEMFATWKEMLLDDHWDVDGHGVRGNLDWFAQHRDVEWRESFIWGDIEDAGGDVLEMSNEWIDDFLLEDSMGKGNDC